MGEIKKNSLKGLYNRTKVTEETTCGHDNQKKSNLINRGKNCKNRRASGFCGAIS